MTVPMTVAGATPARDTPTIEAVSCLSELHDLLTRPRAEGEPLHVLLEGPAAAQIFGEAGAVTVAAAGGEVVAA